jgi:DNA-binding NarL/FixJ family response regulator
MKIAIVDDHQIVIDGIISLLDGHPDMEVVLGTTSAHLLLQKIGQLQPDVLLTDIIMPEMGGRELARKVSEMDPRIRIIVLSMNGSPELVQQMIDESSIAGYIVKNISKQELVKAIETVFNGRLYFSQNISEELKKWKKQSQHVTEDRLTQREIQIILLIEKEMNTKQIAAALHISERTVETHRKNIFRKTQTHTVLGLIKYAYLNRLV